jgi:mannose-1-phosphate guanylyltransferase
MSKHHYAIIMAGGVGTRFWPMSTTQHPKQFLDILGTGQTLLQQTYHRLLQVISNENIYVVTSLAYKGLVTEQLPQLPLENILCESARKTPRLVLPTHLIKYIKKILKLLLLWHQAII